MSQPEQSTEQPAEPGIARDTELWRVLHRGLLEMGTTMPHRRIVVATDVLYEKVVAIRGPEVVWGIAVDGDGVRSLTRRER